MVYLFFYDLFLVIFFIFEENLEMKYSYLYYMKEINVLF